MPYLCVMSLGLPGEKRQPSESRGGQTKGQVPRPDPEAWWIRLPDEEATERGG